MFIVIFFVLDNAFISPMSSNSFFSNAMHLFSSYLKFHPFPLRSYNRGMKGLIHICFGQGYIIFYFSWYRFPERVDSPQEGIAILYSVCNKSYSPEVIDFFKIDSLLSHFVKDTVIMF